jgi:alpha/beta superfamily hydrolase
MPSSPRKGWPTARQCGHRQPPSPGTSSSSPGTISRRIGQLSGDAQAGSGGTPTPKDVHDSLFAYVEMNHIAVAGFDLGAQTAMTVAGEAVDRQKSVEISRQMKCVIGPEPIPLHITP